MLFRITLISNRAIDKDAIRLLSLKELVYRVRGRLICHILITPTGGDLFFRIYKLYINFYKYSIKFYIKLYIFF